MGNGNIRKTLIGLAAAGTAGAALWAMNVPLQSDSPQQAVVMKKDAGLDFLGLNN